MDKKPTIIIGVLCVISLGLGYLSGLKDKESPSKGDNNVQTTEKKEPDFLKEGYTNIGASGDLITYITL